MRLPSGAVSKNPLAKAGDATDMGSIPGLGKSPGVGNGNPLWYYWLGNYMDRGTWRTPIHGVSELGLRSLRVGLKSTQTIHNSGLTEPLSIHIVGEFYGM